MQVIPVASLLSLLLLASCPIIWAKKDKDSKCDGPASDVAKAKAGCDVDGAASGEGASPPVSECLLQLDYY